MIKQTLLGSIFAASLITMQLSSAEQAVAAPKVATSIAPVYSITAAVMKGVGEPHLLIEQSASPHNTELRPSHAKALQDADLVVWIGESLEPALAKPINTVSQKASVLTLGADKEVLHLPVRLGGNWEKHVHGHDDEAEHEHEAEDHDHEAEHKHEAEGHEHEAEHKHEAEDHDHEAEHKHEADEHDDHAHGMSDPHIWLDPQNGVAMAKAIATRLSTLDAENAEQYQSNAKAFTAKMDAVVKEADALLTPVKGKPYIVFHDAYQYFENRFGFSAAGSVLLQPGVALGAARVKEIRAKLKDLKAACLMAEPQFSSKILGVLVEGTDAKLGELDPLGTEMTLGPDLYPQLIKYNATKISECLK